MLVQDPIEKIEFYIKHRNQREEQILEVLNSNRNQTLTPMEVVKIIYKVSTGAAGYRSALHGTEPSRVMTHNNIKTNQNYFVGNSWKLARGSCKKRPTSHSQTDQRRNNHGWYSKFPNELKGLFSCHPHILHCCQYPRGRCQVSNIQLDHFRDSFETLSHLTHLIYR